MGSEGSMGVVRRIKIKNIEAPQSFEYMVFTKDGNPVNLLNLQNLFNL